MPTGVNWDPSPGTLLYSIWTSLPTSSFSCFRVSFGDKFKKHKIGCTIQEKTCELEKQKAWCFKKSVEKIKIKKLNKVAAKESEKCGDMKVLGKIKRKGLRLKSKMKQTWGPKRTTNITTEQKCLQTQTILTLCIL